MTNTAPKTSKKHTGLWIPKDIQFDKSLTPSEKMVVSVIYSMKDNERGCFMSNQALAERVCLSCSSINKIILKLSKPDGHIIRIGKNMTRSLRPNLKKIHAKKDKEVSTEEQPSIHTGTNKYSQADNQVSTHGHIDNSVEKSKNSSRQVGLNPSMPTTEFNLSEATKWAKDKQPRCANIESILDDFISFNTERSSEPSMWLWKRWFEREKNKDLSAPIPPPSYEYADTLDEDEPFWRAK